MLSYTVLAVTLEEADLYAAERAYTSWSGLDAVKLAALRRGQDYIARTYNPFWSSEWISAEAPEEVKYAIIEAAIVELTTPGIMSPFVSMDDRKVLTQVDGIKWTLVGSNSLVPSLTTVESLLHGLTTIGLRIPSILVIE